MPLKSFSVVAVVLLLVVAVSAQRQAPVAGEAMTTAAKRFVETLSAEQKSEAVLPFADPSRTDWHYIPKPSRKGLQVKEMNEEQRKAAFALLASSLSILGDQKATTIMRLEGILRELEKNRQGGQIRDPERYYFTLFGDPSSAESWGLSVEGHHLSLNFVLKDGQVVSSTPTFFGSNPATLLADYTELAGPEFKQGMRVLKDEEQLAYDLINALDDTQRKKAIIAAEAPNDVRDAGKASPPLSPAEGLVASEMKPQQVALLQKLIDAYAHNLPEDVAAKRLAQVKSDGIENVAFCWLGPLETDKGHHYRVQGKSFLIEFNNTQPDSAGNLANHIHSVWHDLRGNFAIPVASN
jgi:hypothetical protein